MLTLFFKRLGWNMFAVKMLAALQGAAKTNIAFLLNLFTKCIYAYIHKQSI